MQYWEYNNVMTLIQYKNNKYDTFTLFFYIVSEKKWCLISNQYKKSYFGISSKLKLPLK